MNNLYQKTLALIKPDACSRNLAGTLIKELEDNGFRIHGMKLFRFSEEISREFYKEHHGKDFCEPLVSFMTSNPVIALVLGKEDAILGLRKLLGATNPDNAQEGTIRRRFASDGRHNIMHGSDSPQSAQREIGLIFDIGNEVYDWDAKEYKI